MGSKHNFVFRIIRFDIYLSVCGRHGRSINDLNSVYKYPFLRCIEDGTQNRSYSCLRRIIFRSFLKSERNRQKVLAKSR